MDLYDYKPGLTKRYAEELPDSIRKGQRLTGMTSSQKKFPVAPSIYKFAQHGKAGIWLSELLPHTAKIADEITRGEEHVHRGDQSRSRDHVHSDRQPGGRAAVFRLVGELWAGLRDRRSAGVCGDDFARHRAQGGSAAL